MRVGGADVEVEAAPGGTSERVGDNGGRGINRRTATVALGRSERVRERGKVDLGEERHKWEWGRDRGARVAALSPRLRRQVGSAGLRPCSDPGRRNREGDGQGGSGLARVG